MMICWPCVVMILLPSWTGVDWAPIRIPSRNYFVSTINIKLNVLFPTHSVQFRPRRRRRLGNPGDDGQRQ